MHKIPPIASTRFQPPAPVGTWLDRPRMDELLDQAVHQKLTLIHAPPGFGKSTLAAQWSLALQERGMRTGWLSLDDDDDRTLWFFSHLLDCFQQLFPDLDSSTRDILEERPQDAERYLIPMLINAAQQAGTRAVFVLDDWHVVKDSRTRAAFAKLLENTGDKLGFIVTSRTSLGLPLTDLRIHDQLCEVDAQVIRFNEQESHQFLVNVKGIELSDSEFSELHDQTEGWVAALQLSSVSLKKQTDVSVLLGELGTRQHGVGQYLADNVLEMLDPRLREFLLRISVLTRINAELATYLSEQNDAEQMLEQALHGDLFLQQLGSTRGWYRFHHLFSAFLQTRLKTEHPELFLEMHRRAARWYGDNELVRLSVDHAVLAGEDEFAADVVEEHAMAFIEHSRMSTLLALIDKLPEAETAKRPRLQLARAWAYCLLHFPVETDAALTGMADAMAGDTTLSAPERFILLGDSLVVRECMAMYRDRVPSDDQLHSEVIEQAERLEPWTVSVAANVLTFFKMNRNQRSEAATLQQMAQQHHRRVDGSFSEVYGDCFSGLLAFQDLDSGKAHAFWQRAYDVGSERSGVQSHAAWLPLGLLGKLHYHTGQNAQAKLMLEESLRVGQRAGVVDFMYPVYESLALVLMQNGDESGALDVLQRGQEAGRELSLLRLWARMDTTRARLGLRSERPVAPAGATDRDLTFLEDELLRFDAACLLHTHEPVNPELLRRLEDLSRRMCNEGNRFQGLRDRVTLISLLELDGSPDRAAELLNEIIPVCMSSGMVQIIKEGGPSLEAISRRVVEGLSHHPDTAALALWLDELWQQDEESGLQDTADAVSIPEGTGPNSMVLSQREREVLQLLAQGKTNREIAATLFLGINTIKWYLRKLFRLLNVSDREQCVGRARRLGLLTES